MSDAGGQADGETSDFEAEPKSPADPPLPPIPELQPRPARISLRSMLAERRGIASINNINYGRAATALMANDNLHLTDAPLLKTYYRTHISSTIRLAEVLNEKDYVYAAVASFKKGIKENSGA